MQYRVNLSRRTELDLHRIFDFINATASSPAAKWFNGLETIIETLATFPERGALAHFDSTLHFLTYGNKPHIYLIFYRIDQRSMTVTIRHIRNGARAPLTSL